MKTSRILWGLALLLAANLGISTHLLTRHSGTSQRSVAEGGSPVPSEDVGGELASLRRSVGEISRQLSAYTDGENGAAEEVDRRIAELESGLAELAKSLENLDFKKVSDERLEEFRGELGYEKADEYLAAGAPAVAGNGYLQFLEAHPDHPDARNIMHRARNAFAKAGYLDKALWVQEEVIKNFPEFAGRDKYEMAMMLKRARRYDDALKQIEDSIGLSTNDTERINRSFYRAYLIHQRDGNRAGVDAYRDLSKDIAAVGFTDANVGQETLKRISDLESRLSNGAE